MPKPFATAKKHSSSISDAVTDNWVDRKAPKWAQPYFRLSRFDRPIGTWLLLLPCLWAIGLAMLTDQIAQWHDLWIAGVCALGAILMRGAGCTWNDYTDRDFDGAVARTRNRPLPAGDVTSRQALLWMVSQAGIAFILLLSLNNTAIFLGVISLVPVLIYPFAKRFTWWPQIFLGLAFNWGAILAYAAHTGYVGLPSILAYLAGIAWTLFYDTIYAHQDVEDDALIGIKSTARLFGEQSPIWLRRFMWLSAALLGLSVIAATWGHVIPMVIALIGVAGFWAHMHWQLGRLITNDPQRLLELFRSNRNTGLIPALFFAVAAMV